METQVRKVSKGVRVKPIQFSLAHDYQVSVAPAGELLGSFWDFALMLALIVEHGTWQVIDMYN